MNLAGPMLPHLTCQLIWSHHKLSYNHYSDLKWLVRPISNPLVLKNGKQISRETGDMTFMLRKVKQAVGLLPQPHMEYKAWQRRKLWTRPVVNILPSNLWGDESGCSKKNKQTI